MEYITIAAIILGPILAVQAEKFLERRRADKELRLNIFKTLMATRGSILSFAHVEALNRIDLEFSNNKKYTKILSSWKEYFDNLCQKTQSEENVAIWSARNEELLANLLYEMGQSLGYKFEKLLIKRNVYSPIGHEKMERENALIRKGILDILNFENSIPMTLINDEDALAKQKLLHEVMIRYYSEQASIEPKEGDK